jgi:hypothetical protein
MSLFVDIHECITQPSHKAAVATASLSQAAASIDLLRIMVNKRAELTVQELPFTFQ